MNHATSPTFAALVQEFFGPYLLQQRALSSRTVASYRDTFVLLLRYAESIGYCPRTASAGRSQRQVPGGFLDHLEASATTRAKSQCPARGGALVPEVRRAARPEQLAFIEQALAVPMKRFDRRMVGFLPREQMLAVIDVATETWVGQRDRLMLTLMFNTGARVSEIVGVRVSDIALGPTRASGFTARDASSGRCRYGRARRRRSRVAPR